MTKFLKSAVHIILDVIYIGIFIQFINCITPFIKSININEISIKQLLILSYITCILLFLVGIIITFFIKGIQYLVSFYINTFFNKNDFKEMVINIDENNVIRDSYMQLKDGKMIPVTISRIVLNNNTNQDNSDEENQNK